MKIKQPFRLFTFCILILLSITASSQINIHWEKIKAKPLYNSEGQNAPKSYIEEVGGYKATMDFSKTSIQVPFTVELTFFREPDVWHPVYKEAEVLADWSKLVPIQLQVSNKDNLIYNGAWSADPNEFRQTETYNISCNTKTYFDVLIPPLLPIGEFGEKPSDFYDEILKVRIFVRINVLPNDPCLSFNWKTTPSFYLYYDAQKSPTNRKYLGEEDLSSLLVEDILPPQESTTEREITGNNDGDNSSDQPNEKEPSPLHTGNLNTEPIAIPESTAIPEPNVTQEPNVIQKSSESQSFFPHIHNFELCSVQKEMSTEMYNFHMVYPETVKMPIGEELVEWEFYRNDSIPLGYVMKKAISEKLWMNVMKGRTERLYVNPTEEPITDLQSYEEELFVETVEKYKPIGFMFALYYVKGIPNNILAVPTATAHIGKLTHEESYPVHITRIYCCSCGEKREFSSIFRFFFKYNAERFVKRKY